MYAHVAAQSTDELAKASGIVRISEHSEHLFPQFFKQAVAIFTFS